MSTSSEGRRIRAGSTGAAATNGGNHALRYSGRVVRAAGTHGVATGGPAGWGGRGQVARVPGEGEGGETDYTDWERPWSAVQTADRWWYTADPLDGGAYLCSWNDDGPDETWTYSHDADYLLFLVWHFFAPYGSGVLQRLHQEAPGWESVPVGPDHFLVPASVHLTATIAGMAGQGFTGASVRPASIPWVLARLPAVESFPAASTDYFTTAETLASGDVTWDGSNWTVAPVEVDMDYPGSPVRVTVYVPDPEAFTRSVAALQPDGILHGGLFLPNWGGPGLTATFAWTVTWKDPATGEIVPD